MLLNFKKKSVVGVSVSPEAGIEVAQIDYETKTVLKYASRPLAYDIVRKEIADRDLFKESLKELLEELQIPKGTEIVLNLPPVAFKVKDYPAICQEAEILSAIDEELIEHPIFQNEEACVSAVALPNSTIQFTKIAYTVVQKGLLIEIAMQIRDLGYKLITIDTSFNSVLNALIYNERVDVSPDLSWVLLIVENNYCKLFSMIGRNYVDSVEERISIGEVLGDDENYSIVTEALAPILKRVPSKCLYIVSKTNIISAEKLASKLVYGAQIIHQEANVFADAPYLEISADVEEDYAKKISLDVIGAAINREIGPESTAHFNLFNETLGDVYIEEQPPVLKVGSHKIVFSMENMIVATIAFLIFIAIVTLIVCFPLEKRNEVITADVSLIESQIEEVDAFLEKNKDISSSLFDEGDEIRIGLAHNKHVYSYYTIVGTEIPKKLWLTNLKLGKYTTIEGQADNLESIYAFFRNIKDYVPNSDLKLQKLNLATRSKLKTITETESFDTDSIITSMNADFYEFRISNAPEIVNTPAKKDENGEELPEDLESIEE